jgi:hypothetical protein
MATAMGEHEDRVAPVKNSLFDKAWMGDIKPQNILELGIGTGPNLKYIQARSVGHSLRGTLGAFQSMCTCAPDENVELAG